MSRPRFLVTAGNTRERIDAVRDWGNIFTGTTGYQIAKALGTVGEVDLLTSNASHAAEVAAAGPDAPLVRASVFSDHDLLRGMLGQFMAGRPYDGVFMTAAVADYRPARVYEVVDRRPDPSHPGEETWRVRDVQADKVKSSFDEIAVLGRRTEKLVDLFRTKWNHRGLLVKFKLEVGITTGELLRIGEASRKASAADFLVANTLEMTVGPTAGAYLLGPTDHEWVPRRDLPQRMVELAARPLAPNPPATS